MKNLNKTILLILSIISIKITAQELNNEAELKGEAISIVQKFAGLLKPQLKQAIQSGGLEHAINICSTQAPKIASELSMQSGWTVKRVSLKPRNTNTATADLYEQKILTQFNLAQKDGEDVKTLDHSEIVDKKFRYMKAQPVEAICLNCHGSAISAETNKVIKQHYPDDIATGYSLGEIRGAFSLVKELE
jgi:hypothetical protein